MAVPPEVAVIGMRALRKDINRLADDQGSALYRAIKQAGKEAVEPVAARVRSALPNVSGTLAGTVRTSGTKTGGTVREGSKKVPYAGWIDFGGSRPDGSSRPFIRDGRYMYPSATGLATVAAEKYGQAIERILNDPSVWTNTTNKGGEVHD
jgi:hypothetical protein